MLAEPAARALAHALRFSEQVRTSDTLQHSLLPEAILPIPDLEVATRYLAATEGQAVGGDFYDVIQVSRRGRGAHGGRRAGQGGRGGGPHEHRSPHPAHGRARWGGPQLDAAPAQRGAALRPGRAPRRRRAPVGPVRDRCRGGADAHAVGLPGRGGQWRPPAPIVIRPSGGVDQLTTEGPLLGVFEDPSYQERVVDLGLSDVLVLYTDGVTEQRQRPDVFDEVQLGRLVRNMLTARHADAVAQLILDTVVDLNPREVRDDIALLVARVVGPR